jgi:hypothetical protein
MIRIDAGRRCESGTIHVHLRCMYKNVTAFGRVALPPGLFMSHLSGRVGVEIPITTGYVLA